MKTNEFKVYEDCGIFRLVCTDYDRAEYLPSVIINRTGAFIIKSIMNGEPLENIARTLSEGDVSAQQAEGDIEEFLRALACKGYRIE
ncbi:MAG: PqqD family protein [Lachnospiraceae bacterium]|nr:PqqD family protein [Lachnospiraceae bacterium]MDY2759392.1 PqqD family protein [Lachnospiraceae bacterium]